MRGSPVVGPDVEKRAHGPADSRRGIRRATAGSWRRLRLSWDEFGIAAALSGDQAMMEAYRSGDPYLSFAKQANAAPPDATKATHGALREQVYWLSNTEWVMTRWRNASVSCRFGRANF